MKRILINIVALLIFIAVFIGLALIIIHVLALGVVIGLVLLTGFWVKSKFYPNEFNKRDQINSFMRDFYAKTASSRSGYGHNQNNQSDQKTNNSGRIIDIESEKDK